MMNPYAMELEDILGWARYSTQNQAAPFGLVVEGIVLCLWWMYVSKYICMCDVRV